MGFLQRPLDHCEDHDGCLAFDCVTDADILDENGVVIHPAGAVVWVCHGPDTTHLDCRANPDAPMEGYDSTREMCDECKTVFSPPPMAAAPLPHLEPPRGMRPPP